MQQRFVVDHDLYVAAVNQCADFNGSISAVTWTGSSSKSFAEVIQPSDLDGQIDDFDGYDVSVFNPLWWKKPISQHLAGTWPQNVQSRNPNLTHWNCK